MPNTLSYAYYAPTAYYSRVQDTVILFFNFFVLLSMCIYTLVGASEKQCCAETGDPDVMIWSQAFPLISSSLLALTSPHQVP